MKLIVLLVAILVKKFNHTPWWLHHDDWFNRYVDRLEAFSLFRDGGRPLQMLLVCLPIVILVGFSYWLLGGILLGLVGFVISVSVMLFAFGSRDIGDELDEYLLFWRANRKDEYRKKAKEYFALGAWGASDEDMHKAVFGQVLQRSCYYLFTPVFWFWVFGPMGPMVCGLCSLIARQGEAKPRTPGNELVQFAQQLQETVAWLPARMMALTFSVTGQFANVIKPALDAFLAVGTCSYDVLNECATEALSLDALVEDKEEMRIQAERQMLGLQSLLNRTLGLWLAGIALCTILGFTR